MNTRKTPLPMVIAIIVGDGVGVPGGKVGLGLGDGVNVGVGWPGIKVGVKVEVGWPVGGLTVIWPGNGVTEISSGLPSVIVTNWASTKFSWLVP